MSELLSQEELDALLKGEGNENKTEANPDRTLTDEEIDALGEIGNISMGTAATTLFTLLNHKVIITTPEVSITTIKKVAELYPIPFVAVEIQYTKGLKGKNLLIINEEDVKILTDLLMGGDGTNIEGELNDMQLSAISEIMNQMIGSASTSLASMFGMEISISPPESFAINFANETVNHGYDSEEEIVKINFKMQIDGILDSYIMQLIPIDFAKEMVKSLTGGGTQEEVEDISQDVEEIKTASAEYKDTMEGEISRQQSSDQGRITGSQSNLKKDRTVGVQSVRFQPLEEVPVHRETSNIDIIMDVPLEISVELGNTRKKIQEILELSSGSIIELDKMAGEPVDILVNGKIIAKGEVVVIDDNFGVRITDILSPSNRLSHLR